jgi:fumarylacetoacetate (FAA) hydrolase family protein
MNDQTQTDYTNIPLSPLSSRAWDEWDSWHTISTSHSQLNDNTEIDQAEDLKTLSTTLSYYTARAQQKSKICLDDETWGDWLDKSIVKTSALLAEGKNALVSEVSGVVGKVIAYERDMQARRAGEIRREGAPRVNVDLAKAVSKRLVQVGGLCQLKYSNE